MAKYYRHTKKAEDSEEQEVRKEYRIKKGKIFTKWAAPTILGLSLITGAERGYRFYGPEVTPEVKKLIETRQVLRILNREKETLQKKAEKTPELKNELSTATFRVGIAPYLDVQIEEMERQINDIETRPSYQQYVQERMQASIIAYTAFTIGASLIIASAVWGLTAHGRYRRIRDTQIEEIRCHKESNVI